MFAYRYNRDYDEQNIFCAVDSENNEFGVGHTLPDPTWLVIEHEIKPSDFVYQLNIDISLNEELTPPEHVYDDLFTCHVK